jgi:RNA polymerase sigma factor (sigma-70 family)
VEDLVERAARGDRDAFSTLAGASVDRCYAIAYRIIREPYQAQDAVQRALIGAWQDLPTLRDPGRFDAWLHRLVVNACYMELRTARRSTARLRVLRVDVEEPDATTSVVDRSALEQAFLALSPEQRAVVVLRHYLGWSLTEIARVLDVPEGTIRSRLHYALRRLRAELDPDGREVSAAREGRA